MLKARCYKIILSQYCSDQVSVVVRHDLPVAPSRVYVGLVRGYRDVRATEFMNIEPTTAQS